MHRRQYVKRLLLLWPLGVIAFIWNSWFLNFGIRTAGDWGFYLKVTADTLRRHYFTMWLSDMQFGRVLIDSGQALTYAAYGWLSYYLGTSYALNERLIHLWPAVIVSVVGSYALVKYLFRDSATAVLGTIVYTANTYYLALLTGHLTLSGAYAFVPLIILFYLKAITTQRVVNVLLCTLFLTICGAYEPRTTYIVACILILLAGIHFFLVWLPKHSLKNFLKLVRLLCIYASPLFLFLLLNLYWILGLAAAGGASANSSIIASNLFGNQFFTISEALTLHHPYWTGGLIQPFFAHSIPIYFWLIPVAAICSLLVNRRTPLLFFFALLGVIGILLTKQSDQPFSGLYYWLFMHVPGFNAFREASKFYVLTVLSYTVLLPALYWYVKKKYRRKVVSLALFALLSLLFLPNLVPIFTHKVGATFQSKEIPSGYVQLNKFLNEPSYSRILWVPQSSRWSLESAIHPAVSASTLIGDTWSKTPNMFATTNNATSTDEIISLLQQNFMPSLLSAASIKYIVVPMRDIQNSDNFYSNYNDDPAIFVQALARIGYMHEAPVHINGFKVYETVLPPQPYFSSIDSLYAFNANEKPAEVYSLWQALATPKSSFNFTLAGSRSFTTDVTDLLGQYTGKSIMQGNIALEKPAPRKQSTYYFDQNYAEASYQATASRLTVTTTQLSLPGIHQAASRPAELTFPLSGAQGYAVVSGDTVEPLIRTGATVYLGSPRSDTVLYAEDASNLIPKPSIDGSLWEATVRNCAPYGNGTPNIDMMSTVDPDVRRSVLSLSATDHAACTGPPAISVESGATYMWQFQYKSSHAQLASYQLIFNDSHGTVVAKDIPVSDDSWHTVVSTVTVPTGATSVRVLFIARPSNQLGEIAAVSYAGALLAQMHRIMTIVAGVHLQPLAQDVPSQEASYKGYPYANLIPNGSFEKGLWQKQVGDCDAYDTQPLLHMSLSTVAPAGSNRSLQLEAARHIACTYVSNIPVQGGATYVLRFDYQSPNAQQASFLMRMDDKNVTSLNETIPISDTKWHTYTKVFTVPSDAHTVALSVFADSEYAQPTYFINRYDNFLLQRVPDVQNRFYAVSSPAMQLTQPTGILYRDVSSTLKRVTVTGARGPFMLTMSEAYHPGWQVVLGNFGAWPFPWDKLPVVATADHMEINNFQNAWLIQPSQVCSAYPTTCVKNSDGSYTMRFSVLFSAERWFNFGLLVSGLVALGMCGLLLLSLKRCHIKLPGRATRDAFHYRQTR